MIRIERDKNAYTMQWRVIRSSRWDIYGMKLTMGCAIDRDNPRARDENFISEIKLRFNYLMNLQFS